MLAVVRHNVWLDTGMYDVPVWVTLDAGDFVKALIASIANG